MARNELLIHALSGFARILVGRFDIAHVLSDLTAQVATVLEISSAGVSLGQDDGRLAFVTALDETAARLERTQEGHQAGPCVDAFRTGESVCLETLDEAAGRWPDFVATARQVGVVAVAGIPMRLDERSLGVLDLYHTAPRRWSDDDLRVAGVLADMATSYLVNASELERQQRTAEQLQRALASRIVIEQAKGIVAAERRISVDQAFEVLRQHARRHRADLRSTAEAVVRLGLRP